MKGVCPGLVGGYHVTSLHQHQMGSVTLILHGRELVFSAEHMQGQRLRSLRR